MTVAVVSCLYGDRGYERFIPAWAEAVAALDSPPAEIIVAADRGFEIPGATVIVSRCTWRYPQAYYLQQAFEVAKSEWVWHVDLDDLALPDALDRIDDVVADVWQMGFVRSDGLTYVPPQITAAEYLASTGNPFVGSSAIRKAAFQRCGGYPDVAFEDWGLWRRLAHAGATFESSGRPHFRYELGSHTRSSVELTAAARPLHIEELRQSETKRP